MPWRRASELRPLALPNLRRRPTASIKLQSQCCYCRARYHRKVVERELKLLPAKPASQPQSAERRRGVQTGADPTGGYSLWPSRSPRRSIQAVLPIPTRNIRSIRAQQQRAIDTMSQSEHERFAPWARSVPTAGDEPQWGAAFLKTVGTSGGRTEKRPPLRGQLRQEAVRPSRKPAPATQAGMERPVKGRYAASPNPLHAHR